MSETQAKLITQCGYYTQFSAFYQLGKAEMKILIESGKKIGKSDENVKNFGSEIVQGVVRTFAGRLVEITTKWNTMSTENNSKILEYNKKLNVFLSEGNMKAAFEELNKYKEKLEENLKKTNQLLAEKYKTLDPLKTRLAGEKIYNKGMSTFYKKLVTQTEQKISDLTQRVQNTENKIEAKNDDFNQTLKEIENNQSAQNREADQRHRKQQQDMDKMYYQTELDLNNGLNTNMDKFNNAKYESVSRSVSGGSWFWRYSYTYSSFTDEKTQYEKNLKQINYQRSKTSATKKNPKKPK